MIYNNKQYKIFRKVVVNSGGLLVFHSAHDSYTYYIFYYNKIIDVSTKPVLGIKINLPTI